MYLIQPYVRNFVSVLRSLDFLDTQDFSTDLAENRLNVTIILQTLRHKKMDTTNCVSWTLLF